MKNLLMNQRAIMKTVIMKLILVKLKKNEMDININRDYLQDFNDRIEDNDSSSGIFKDYFRVKSDTNGNCLFSSLSLAISWGEISPNEIRQLICDYIEQNKEFFFHSTKKEYLILTNTLETWEKIKFGVKI